MKIILPAIKVTLVDTRCNADETSSVDVVVSTDDYIGFQVRVSRLISRVKAHRVIGQLMSSCPDCRICLIQHDEDTSIDMPNAYTYIRNISSLHLSALTKMHRTSFVYSLSDRFGVNPL